MTGLLKVWGVKAVVFGSGMMGSAIARDLVKSNVVDAVVICDVDRKRLSALAQTERSEKLSVIRHDVRNRSSTVKLLRRSDVGIGALPQELSDYGVKSALQAGVSFVDLIFGWRFERNQRLHEAAKRREITIVPACGLAPGLTNVLAVNAAQRMSTVDEVHIKVGGIPQTPRPPLNYRIVFSFDAVIEEYVRKAKIIRNGKIAKVEALSGLETVTFPKPIGECECFYTDGLSTLTETLRGVKEMDEKTIRWPGHASQILTLIECGLLDTSPLRYGGQAIVPREVVSKILSKRIKLGEEKDLTVLRVDVRGRSGGVRVDLRYQMIDHYDSKRKMTSMARTTAFPCSVAAQMVGTGMVHRRGLVPPELAFEGEAGERFLEQLRQRGLEFTLSRR